MFQPVAAILASCPIAVRDVIAAKRIHSISGGSPREGEQQNQRKSAKISKPAHPVAPRQPGNQSTSQVTNFPARQPAYQPGN